MPQFMVLAYNPKVPPQLSPEEVQKIFQRFYEWTSNLKKRGILASSAKLVNNEGRVLREKGGDVTVTDGPYQESKEILGGYWMIEAASYDEALEIVGIHPNFAFGGMLEVRQVEPT
jgi:hypothetical protein